MCVTQKLPHFELHGTLHEILFPYKQRHTFYRLFLKEEEKIYSQGRKKTCKIQVLESIKKL